MHNSELFEMTEKYNLHKTVRHYNTKNNGKLQNLSRDTKVCFRTTKLSKRFLSWHNTALQHQAPKTQLMKRTHGHSQNENNSTDTQRKKLFYRLPVAFCLYLHGRDLRILLYMVGRPTRSLSVGHHEIFLCNKIFSSPNPHPLSHYKSPVWALFRSFGGRLGGRSLRSRALLLAHSLNAQPLARCVKNAPTFKNAFLLETKSFFLGQLSNARHARFILSKKGFYFYTKSPG